MNVQLHHVIADIMGMTGQAIVRAIVAGERDPATLARLRERRIKADEAEIARALQGHWRDEHLFALRQALALIDAYAAQIAECDGKLQELLGALKGHEVPEEGFSGGKVLSSATKPCANRAAQALRMAAQALRKSQSALGAHHRRLCSRMDKPKAITASAHKLARLVYFMLTKGRAFVEAGQQEYEEQFRQRMVHNLNRRAHQLGFELSPRTAPEA